jgi:predicted RNA-binding protein with PIN domain
MPFLIDGYNLLHAMGRITRRAGPHGLEKARAGLLGLLAAVHTDPATVVFDARGALPGARNDFPAGPVHVLFARGEEADDRIEYLIAHDSAPKKLVVVSDDHRVQTAARRRGAAAWACDEYLRWLNGQRKESTRLVTPEKPDAVPAAEIEGWLNEFGRIEEN